MTTKEIFEAAMSLPPDKRDELAELLGSLRPEPEPEIEQAWVEEAIARARALDEGRAKTVASDEVMARAYARLRDR